MFAFRLAAELGFAHPRELLRRLTSLEVAEWMGYYLAKAEVEGQAARAAGASAEGGPAAQMTEMEMLDNLRMAKAMVGQK